MTDFSNEELQIIRHFNSCKCCLWEDSKGYVCISNAIYDKLFKWKVPVGFNPSDTLPDEIKDTTFFVADTGERRYLVNTEGFSYIRYFAFLVVCDNYSKYSDYEFSLLKHYNGSKLNDWNYAAMCIEHIYIPKSLYDKLPKLNVSTINPSDVLPQKFKGEFFIAIHNDNNFIVNTEGTDFSRYVAPLSIIE